MPEVNFNPEIQTIVGNDQCYKPEKEKPQNDKLIEISFTDAEKSENDGNSTDIFTKISEGCEQLEEKLKEGAESRKEFENNIDGVKKDLDEAGRTFKDLSNSFKRTNDSFKRLGSLFK